MLLKRFYAISKGLRRESIKICVCVRERERVREMKGAIEVIDRGGEAEKESMCEAITEEGWY